MEHVFISDLLPIFVIMILGYAAGKRRVFTEDNARAFNKLVLDFALPAALFLSIVQADRAMLFEDTTLTIVSLVVLVLFFLGTYYCCKLIFKHTKGEAAVCALIAGSPTVGFLGFAFLDPIYGAGTNTGLVVAIVAIVVNAVTIPIGLFLLNPSDGNAAKKSNALVSALKEPVVWAPILAVVLVLVGVPFPKSAAPTFTLIAKANSGVAVFAAGLTLAAHKFEFDREIIFNTILKLVLMPAILLGIGMAAGISAEKLQMLVLIGALPPAFSGTIIASRFNTYVQTGTSSLAVSMLFFVIAAPVWIYIVRAVAPMAG